MGVEIERRFPVTDPGWRSLAGPSQSLRQGYLAASAEGVTVRIRLKAAETAWLTLKAPADSVGLVRHEFEYAIPVADAEAMWSLAPQRLEKTRFHLDLPGGDWVVDCFAGGNAPLVLAEVELPSALTPLEIPHWCGLEITGDGRWSNAMLARQPLQSWPVDQRRPFGYG